MKFHCGLTKNQITINFASSRQVATLKDQLGQEMRKRQQYISKSARTGDEIRDLRGVLDGSLRQVINYYFLFNHL